VTRLVIGVGAPDAGDDAVGLLVCELVRLAAPSVRVLTTTSPTALLDFWQPEDEVVVVDCVRTGAPPGSVEVRRLGTSPGSSRTTARGTHGFGVADAVELARALDRLPRRVDLVGVEGADLALGAPLSPAVVAAVPAAVQAVLALAGSS
jgi:hydrogenase maturation protease